MFPSTTLAEWAKGAAEEDEESGAAEARRMLRAHSGPTQLCWKKHF
jgi:hypothetical protein